ncbi:cation transporter [Ramlibacter sp. G-1-2-2]|uniref:Cation transporter n=1 Tax=Ramlibacter agri TaxID=2728837 RepID=A0A848H8X8_9BURK|nr:cation diffusion facilitator family transporter [Ramlibacter agri]NML47235.1 cation transporter [Ramlibacter agri]
MAHDEHSHHDHSHGHDDHGHHDHDHGHHHGHHHHAPASFGRAFAIGIVLNAGFVVAEAVFGIAADSVALLADAAHNLGDVLSLLVAWGAMLLAQRMPSQRFTYGLRGTSILAALVNALALLLVTGALAWEAVRRLADAPPVAGGTVIVIALIGVVINGVTAWLFMRGAKHDLNLRGAYLHMAADAAVSLAVAIAGGLVLATGWNWLDPAATLVVSAVIVWGTWDLLKQSLRLALQAVPATVDEGAVRATLAALPGVTEVHDLHIWAMSTTENALTVHLVMPAGHPGDAFLQGLCRELKEHHQIHHTTVQIEVADTQQACALAPDHVV